MDAAVDAPGLGVSLALSLLRASSAKGFEADVPSWCQFCVQNFVGSGLEKPRLPVLLSVKRWKPNIQGIWELCSDGPCCCSAFRLKLWELGVGMRAEP